MHFVCFIKNKHLINNFNSFSKTFNGFLEIVINRPILSILCPWWRLWTEVQAGVRAAGYGSARVAGCTSARLRINKRAQLSWSVLL